MTLSACAASPATDLKPAPDPIVQTRTVTRVECPAELTAELFPRVEPYVGAAVVAPPGYFDWLGAHLRRELLLEKRLADGKASCPHD